MRAAYDIMVGYTAIRIFMHAGGGNVSSNQSGCRIASHLEVKYFKLKPPLRPDLLPARARLLPCPASSVAPPADLADSLAAARSICHACVCMTGRRPRKQMRRGV